MSYKSIGSKRYKSPVLHPCNRSCGIKRSELSVGFPGQAGPARGYRDRVHAG